MVEFLIAAGANPNVYDHWHYTPLQLVVSEYRRPEDPGYSEAVVRLLLASPRIKPLRGHWGSYLDPVDQYVSAETRRIQQLVLERIRGSL